MNNLALISGYQSSSDSESNEEEEEEQSASVPPPPPPPPPPPSQTKPIDKKQTSDLFFTISQPEIKAVPEEPVETEAPTSDHGYDSLAGKYKYKYKYKHHDASARNLNLGEGEERIVEIKQSDQLSQQIPSDTMDKRRAHSIDNAVSRTKKHKNNIMYLAAQAKELGPGLREAHAQRKQARRAARAKYGY